MLKFNLVMINFRETKKKEKPILNAIKSINILVRMDHCYPDCRLTKQEFNKGQKHKPNTSMCCYRWEKVINVQNSQLFSQRNSLVAWRIQESSPLRVEKYQLWNKQLSMLEHQNLETYDFLINFMQMTNIDNLNSYLNLFICEKILHILLLQIIVINIQILVNDEFLKNYWYAMLMNIC